MKSFCTCETRRYLRVAHRRHGHPWGFRRKGRPSEYSDVVCLNCGKRSRTKAEYIRTVPDYNYEEAHTKRKKQVRKIEVRDQREVDLSGHGYCVWSFGRS